MSTRPLLNIANPSDILLMGAGGASFGIQGFVHSPNRRIAAIRLDLVQGDTRVPATHHCLQAGLVDPRISSAIEANGAAGLDGGFFVSATFPPHPALRAGLATVDAAITWDNGCADELRLCFVQVERVQPLPLPAAAAPAPDGGPLVGIAMATHDPEPALFARQVASLREQTHRSWVCVISDDGSTRQSLRHIKETVAGDERFVVLEGRSRLGFYRNFERALASLPAECRFVALSDQDDAWKADRLAADLDACAGGGCVFSDMEVVSAGGRRLSPSFWVHRRQRFGSISGLMLANVATGMTMLAGAELIARALPFPATPNLTYHDAWIALLAEAGGALRYLPRPLVEYVQHGGNHTGALKAPDRSRNVLRRSLDRLARTAGIPLRRALAPDQIHKLLLEANFWGGAEAARMRILADALGTRVPAFEKTAANRRLLRLCRRFGPLALARAGIDWKDRHRRSVAVALLLDGVTQRLVLAYAGWSRRRAFPSP